MRRMATILLLSLASVVTGQDATARRIMEQSNAARPTAAKLRFYDLDWASSLTQARQRAAEEKRPIVFIWVTNITAGCDFFTGHT